MGFSLLTEEIFLSQHVFRQSPVVSDMRKARHISARWFVRVVTKNTQLESLSHRADCGNVKKDHNTLFYDI